MIWHPDSLATTFTWLKSSWRLVEFFLLKQTVYRTVYFRWWHEKTNQKGLFNCVCWINVRKRVREYLECNGGSICSRFQFENQLHVLKSIEFFMVFILLSCEWHGESTNANKIAEFHWKRKCNCVQQLS